MSHTKVTRGPVICLNGSRHLDTSLTKLDSIPRPLRLTGEKKVQAYLQTHTLMTLNKNKSISFFTYPVFLLPKLKLCQDQVAEARVQSKF